MDTIIDIIVEIADIFVHFWANKIVKRSSKKKRENEESDNAGE